MNYVTTALKLVKIDITDKENQLDAVSIKLGAALKDMLSALGATDVKIPNFKKECKDSVIAIIAKLQERSLLQYTVVRMASSLSPHNMVRAKDKSLTGFNLLAEKVAKLKWMSPDEADEAKTKYLRFIDTDCDLFKDKFLAFDAANDCVDTLLGTFLHGQKEYASLLKVSLFGFVLSHGQSAVERGFSANENMLVENLEYQSLIGRQVVYDHMFSQKIKLESYEPPLDLIKSCSKGYG